ncbi:MAG: hypothetical protein P1P88_24200 [Bacteroidales bacterium]|nr:hypothetical protein [Bacteroidales bacterium]
MEQTINKTMVTRAVISNFKEDKIPKTIRAKHLKGFDTPEKVSKEGEDSGYIPDIEAVFDDETIIYEIELDKTMLVEKWELLSSYARDKNGNLYLVVPDYLKDTIVKEIKDKDVNAGIVYFNTK